MRSKRIASSTGSASKTVSKKPKLDQKSTIKKTQNDKKVPKLPPKAVKKILKLTSKTVNYTLCIPTSILDNCSNLEQITHTIYQVAKSATLFNAWEIIVLDLGDSLEKQHKGDLEGKKAPQKKIKFNEPAASVALTASTDKAAASSSSSSTRKKLTRAMLIATLLQYFVTPPYLISSVFKKKYAGYFKVAAKLPRLSALPFMRHLSDDKGRYREGLSVRMKKPTTINCSTSKTSKMQKKPYEKTSYINIGKGEYLELKGQMVPVNVRVTVDTVSRRVVSPTEAYGDYVGVNASYGYHVRVAPTFPDVFTQCGHSEGYTQAIWVNSGDFFHEENRSSIKIPRIERIIRPTDEELADGAAPSNVLLFFGKLKHLQHKFNESAEQFDGAQGVQSFFDGQLDLPGSCPEGYVCIEDSCLIALTCLNHIV
ncbi:HFR118Wp [Eremothecium sinecaudum]|uniref:HFR118Wp n=1 Tax=Eremothecium sinecaudum TaxID=45286 RepID=A0A109V041_9SACH|nr:HFR118Wp [Eremothecium sinecaudum]AMD21973.1 HFR118Wp [Eremothecium sinecaudum]